MLINWANSPLLFPFLAINCSQSLESAVRALATAALQCSYSRQAQECPGSSPVSAMETQPEMFLPQGLPERWTTHLLVHLFLAENFSLRGKLTLAEKWGCCELHSHTSRIWGEGCWYGTMGHT
jgi:hypothetical protein